MRTTLRLAWLSSIRQPARTGLGILGIVAVGALLFDMLLLSRGLVISFGDLLNRQGFDIRVLATDSTPRSGPPLDHANAAAAAISALPSVQAAAPVRIGEADVVSRDDRAAVDRAPLAGATTPSVQVIGVDPSASPMWTLVNGRDLPQASPLTMPILVNRRLAAERHLTPGSRLTLRGHCEDETMAAPPVAFTVAGIAEFPFDDATDTTAAGSLADLGRLCGRRDDRADMLLVRSNPRVGADAAAAAIRALRPDLHVVTNEQIIERFTHVEFSYFQQISFVLSTLTLFFGFLLIAVLLTVSVNQRLGEIAALRAVGLSRARVMAGVLCESAIVVGAGGVLAIPAGLILSVWLDRILRALPGIPTGVSFFAFEPRAVVLYALLLAAAAAGAALYPMRIVGTLPIAGTLRREAVS